MRVTSFGGGCFGDLNSALVTSRGRGGGRLLAVAVGQNSAVGWPVAGEARKCLCHTTPPVPLPAAEAVPAPTLAPAPATAPCPPRRM
jgi:hypothetical protein